MVLFHYVKYFYPKISVLYIPDFISDNVSLYFRTLYFSKPCHTKLPSLPQFGESSKGDLIFPILLRGNLRRWEKKGVPSHSEDQG